MVGSGEHLKEALCSMNLLEVQDIWVSVFVMRRCSDYNFWTFG
jgi:hypothetical protein